MSTSAILALTPGTPEWEEAIQPKTTTPCKMVLLDFKHDGTWKFSRGDLEGKLALTEQNSTTQQCITDAKGSVAVFSAAFQPARHLWVNWVVCRLGLLVNR